MDTIFASIFLFIVAISGIWVIVSVCFTNISNSILTIPFILHYIKNKTHFQKNKKEFHAYLNSNFEYYRKLTPNQQKKFLTRVSEFIAIKKFIPKENCEIHRHHKLKIAASAIQLTFGLDSYLLLRFHSIFIYPSHYLSKSLRYHKGEVSMNGTISLSIKDFELGYENNTDGINLGLHEMAHALKFDQLMEQDEENFFYNYYRKFEKEALEEMKNTSNEHFIRLYGKTNINEFFAVCIENFFERPQLFKKELKELYLHLSILLNQDPTTQYTDYNQLRQTISKDTEQLKHLTRIISSKYNYRKTIVFGFLILFTYLFQWNEIMYAILGIGFVLSFLDCKKIHCTSEGIALSNPISNFKTGIYYTDIIFVQLYNGNLYQTELRIKYKTQGYIKEIKIQTVLTKENAKQFYTILRKQNVLIYK
jgi:Mlc titration factor MtfA (ptsG expression regulator)